MTGEGYLLETAVLSAEMIATWKKERGVYNFKTLPNKAIIALHKSIFSQQLSFHSKKINGISGTNYIDGAYLYCSGFGSGAPALIMLMEELRALGVLEFIFIGLCGSLMDNMPSGTAFCVDKAWSANGITLSYFSGNVIEPYHPQYIKDISGILNLEATTCFSTDSPFRETPSLLDEVKRLGCKLIEMECAAAYAFSHFYKLKVACLLVVADQLTNGWQPPVDMNHLLSVQKQLINNIVKRVL